MGQKHAQDWSSGGSGPLEAVLFCHDLLSHQQPSLTPYLQAVAWREARWRALFPGTFVTFAHASRVTSSVIGSVSLFTLFTIYFLRLTLKPCTK